MEKWLQSKPSRNPWLGQRNKKIVIRKGQVAKMFADSDRDGVANVFDCQPYNRRKQDAIAPMVGNNPMQEMFQRQEYSRQMQAQQRQLAELQRQNQLAQQEGFLPSTVNVYPTDYVFPFGTGSTFTGTGGTTGTTGILTSAGSTGTAIVSSTNPFANLSAPSSILIQKSVAPQKATAPILTETAAPKVNIVSSLIGKAQSAISKTQIGGKK